MYKVAILISVITILWCSLVSAALGQTRIVDANWYDGEKFRDGTIYIIDGKFSFQAPLSLDTTIDFSGKYLIPPFGESHTHNLASPFRLQQMIDGYVNEGTIYIQVLGCSQRGRNYASATIEKSPLQVQYANGPITSTLGHPFMVYEPLAMGIYSPVQRRERMEELRLSRLAEKDSYWFMDDIKSVDQQWDEYKKGKPDVVKIMLLNAEHYDSLHSAPEAIGRKGLSYQVAHYVVEKAKKDSLPVIAHIETAKDFEYAVKLGVDAVAHIPGYSWTGDLSTRHLYDLSDSSLQAAAKINLIVITTAAAYSTAYGIDVSPELLAFQKKQLNKIQKAGLRISIGTDQIYQTLLPEVLYLSQHSLLDNQTILKSICEINPQFIFPKRLIGEIKEGYEANFLVLDENPLLDIRHIQLISALYLAGNKVIN